MTVEKVKKLMTALIIRFGKKKRSREIGRGKVESKGEGKDADCGFPLPEVNTGTEGEAVES